METNIINDDFVHDSNYRRIYIKRNLDYKDKEKVNSMDYKEVLKGILNIINTTENGNIGFINIRNYIDKNCPELKESEDERMLRVLREGFNLLDKDDEWYSGITNGQILAWLFKQGKNKFSNKVKFYEGEWLFENEPNNYARLIQILEIVNVQGKEKYRISRDLHNDEDIVEFDFLEKYYHEMTF